MRKKVPAGVALPSATDCCSTVVPDGDASVLSYSITPVGPISVAPCGGCQRQDFHRERGNFNASEWRQPNEQRDHRACAFGFPAVLKQQNA